MKNQNEITSSLELLDRHGHLNQEGWARQPFWRYNRRAIKAPWFRIKEWDYYYVLSEEHNKGITFTFSDLGYAGLMAICWLDFDMGTAEQADTITLLPRGRLTSQSEGPLEFSDDKIELSIHHRSRQHRLEFSAGGLDLSGELILEQPEGDESLNIASSWAENRRRFYYNQKITCMNASGTVKVRGIDYRLSPDSAFGGLDWGRGAWTYRNRWFWASGSGRLEGDAFGFNFGYGFSDRTSASENALFHRGKAHKLGELVFGFDPDNYTAPWTIKDEDGRLDLRFNPIVDRNSSVNLGIIRSVQHQVFGRFTGTAVLDDGTELKLDKFLGFAEDVLNNW